MVFFANTRLIGVAQGEAVANPIAAARLPNGDNSIPNAVWAAAGATIDDRSTIYTTLSSSSTIGQVNTAIDDCPVGQVVQLNSGTFTLSDSVVMKTGVTLRGSGAGVTILNFTGVGSAANGYFWGGGNVGVVMTGAYSSPSETTPGMSNVPSRPGISWTGTHGNSGVYTQGATVINLGATPTGLAVGDTLVLWQDDELSSSLPKAGWWFSSENDEPNAVCSEGNSEHRDAATQYRARVTNISGTAVTITPGIPHPTGTWKTGNSPLAGWFQDTDEIRDAGLEDLTVQTTSIPDFLLAGVGISWASNCWVKNVALNENATDGAAEYGFYVTETRNITIKNCWIDEIKGGGGFGNTTSYGIAFKCTHNSLFENNIFADVESPFMVLICSTGNVVAYNYEHEGEGESGLQAHQPGSCMNLIEGNSWDHFWADHFHGNSNCNTMFRNAMTGNGFNLHSYHRFYNLVGNAVAVTTAYKSLASDSTKRSRFDSVGFRLGYPRSDASSDPLDGVDMDDDTWTTALMWGNYCTFDATSHFDSSEVPSTDPDLPNPVPSSQSLPTSLYRTSMPGFFTVSGVGTVDWPPCGPDVTGGDVIDGHAHKLPAQLVYDDAAGNVANFDPSLYGDA